MIEPQTPPPSQPAIIMQLQQPVGIDSTGIFARPEAITIAIYAALDAHMGVCNRGVSTNVNVK